LVIIRSIPLVLAVAIALSGCQAPIPGVTSPEAQPGATSVAGAPGAVPAPGPQAPAPVDQTEVRTFTGVATYQGQPLAGYDVSVYDAVTGQPAPLVESFLGDQAGRYRVSSLDGGAGPSLLNHGLVTDEQGIYRLRLSGLALGQALKVVISKGNVALETVITADAEDLGPVVTDEVDDSFLVGDPDMAALLNPDAALPRPLDELLADPALQTLSPGELAAFVSAADVDDALIERAIGRGELDLATPSVAGFVAALEADLSAGEALLDAADTAAVRGEVPADVVAEVATGYLVLSSGLFVHRSVLATSALARPFVPASAAPKGQLVKGPDGKVMLEVPVTKTSEKALVTFQANVKAMLVDLAKELGAQLMAARAKAAHFTPAQFATLEKRTLAQFHQRTQHMLAVRTDAVSKTVAGQLALGQQTGRSPVELYLEQLKAEAAKQAAAKEAAMTADKADAAAKQQALHAHNVALAAKQAEAHRRTTTAKQAAAKTLLKGKAVLPLQERLTLAGAQRSKQAENEAKLKAAGIKPQRPAIVQKPDGRTVAVVPPRIRRQVNEVTTAQSKLVAGVFQTSRLLEPKAAAVVHNKAIQAIRRLSPKLKATFTNNPNAAGDLVKSTSPAARVLNEVVSMADVKRESAQILTSLVTDIAQQSKIPGNLSPMAADPAVVQRLKQVTLPGTAFASAFDPAKGLTLTNTASGLSVDASSTSAVAAAVAISLSTGSSSAPAAPAITGLSATGFARGETLTITGTAFSATAADNAVSFNGTAATPTAATATSLTVTVPAGATTGNLTVTTHTGVSNPSSYFVYRTDMVRSSLAVPASSLYGGRGAGLAIERTTDKLYVVRNNATPRSVARYNTSTNAEEAVYAPTGASTLTEASAVAIDKDGLIYVADGNGFGGSSGDKVVRVNPADGTATVFISGVNNPTGLAFDSAGNLYVASFDDNAVYKYSSAGAPITVTPGGAAGLLAGDFNARPCGLAVDAQDNVYVAAMTTVAGTSGNSIYKVTAEGQKSIFYTQAGLLDPHTLAVDAKGHLWATIYNSSLLLRISPSGAATTFPGGWPSSYAPNGVAIDSTGTVFTYNNDHVVYKFPGAAPPRN
jgi:sugar lactone lactonase YvrE